MCCRFKYTLTCRDFIHAKISIVCGLHLCMDVRVSRSGELGRSMRGWPTGMAARGEGQRRIRRGYDAGRPRVCVRPRQAGPGGGPGMPAGGARTPLYPTYHRADTYYYFFFLPALLLSITTIRCFLLGQKWIRKR